ncbi:MAG: hypothetical protein ABH828_03830 [archaeon]
MTHRHDKVRNLLKEIISQVDEIEKKEYDNDRKRSKACDEIADKVQEAYALVNQLKKEFDERI